MHCLVANVMTPARSLASCIACIYPGGDSFPNAGVIHPQVRTLGRIGGGYGRTVRVNMVAVVF